MEISLLQAFALGIIAFIAGLDMFNGLTHMHRPVVLGPLVGLVLGDLHTGILTGGTLELVWMGLAPLAGAQPPNVIIGTIVGTAFAITTGVKPDVAVGVAVPFRCRSTDGDYLPVLGDVRRDVSLRPDGGERRYSRH
ncbi:PTS sorbose-specific transporter subunit IIC [Escherichia coli]|nr:PTS sorbose-specific transporter subunit IIC [Escherichia coli]